MCVVFQFLPTWEKPQEDLQFLYETYPQTALKQALKKKRNTEQGINNRTWSRLDTSRNSKQKKKAKSIFCPKCREKESFY